MKPTDDLTRIANELQLDKGTEIPNDGRHHGPRLFFTTVYSDYFEEIRNQPIKILEMGVSTGNSLKMWERFFPNASVFGVDIVNSKHFETDRIKVFQADQGNRQQLLNVFDQVGELDIIIDDGSHVVSHQQITLAVGMDYVKPGGMYWIEDLHTSDGSVWWGQTLYGNNMSFPEGQSTVDFLERIQRGIYESVYVSNEELESLKNDVESCELFDLPKTFYGENKLCLLRKY